MHPLFEQVSHFLNSHCTSKSPLLLALSGGPDSLSLFYALLYYRQTYAIPFHIAHVDHGWRPESGQEAQALQQLSLKHAVPFHLKVLNPDLLKGNLEDACRKERYAFFAQLCHEFPFQAVLTGHHQDDQAETIFKRLLEGAHWSCWSGLKAEKMFKGMRILRPLLSFSKKEIQKLLSEADIKAFEDPTNRQVQFLRARLRESIFPRLNQEFGKQVQQSLTTLGSDTQELTEYFDELLAPLMKRIIQGPWGKFLDLENLVPNSLLEIKYLLRSVCKDMGFFLSRTILEQASAALKMGKANQHFAMGLHHIWIDRQRIFFLFPSEKSTWNMTTSEEIFSSDCSTSSWKEAWQGQMQCYLPLGSYQAKSIINFEASQKPQLNLLKKRWNQAKIPAFLYYFFPFIFQNECISHEFLTGKPLTPLKSGSSCLKFVLSFQQKHAVEAKQFE